jgi:hypothetical protein
MFLWCLVVFLATKLLQVTFYTPEIKFTQKKEAINIIEENKLSKLTTFASIRRKITSDWLWAN